MIYYQVMEITPQMYVVTDRNNIQVGRSYSTRAEARAKLWDLAAQLQRDELEKVRKTGKPSDLELMTWLDMVMDPDTFVEYYRREMCRKGNK